MHAKGQIIHFGVYHVKANRSHSVRYPECIANKLSEWEPYW